MTGSGEVAAVAARVFLDERVAVLATLIRQPGDFQLAEDSVQDAFESALATWPRDGIPRIRAPGSSSRRGGGRLTGSAGTAQRLTVPPASPSSSAWTSRSTHRR